MGKVQAGLADMPHIAVIARDLIADTTSSGLENRAGIVTQLKCIVEASKNSSYLIEVYLTGLVEVKQE